MELDYRVMCTLFATTQSRFNPGIKIDNECLCS